MPSTSFTTMPDPNKPQGSLLELLVRELGSLPQNRCATGRARAQSDVARMLDRAWPLGLKLGDRRWNAQGTGKQLHTKGMICMWSPEGPRSTNSREHLFRATHEASGPCGAKIRPGCAVQPCATSPTHGTTRLRVTWSARGAARTSRARRRSANGKHRRTWSQHRLKKPPTLKTPLSFCWRFPRQSLACGRALVTVSWVEPTGGTTRTDCRGQPEVTEEDREAFATSPSSPVLWVGRPTLSVGTDGSGGSSGPIPVLMSSFVIAHGRPKVRPSQQQDTVNWQKVLPPHARSSNHSS